MLKGNAGIAVIGFVCMALGAMAGAWPSNPTPDPADTAAAPEPGPALGGATFTVSDQRHRFEYELEDGATTLDGVLAMTGAQRGVPEGGAVLTLHYLSDAAVTAFEETHGTTTKCPAPFFNRHARQRILVPATPEIERQLRRVSFADYQATERWRRFSVQGHCIRSAPVVMRDGKPGQLPRNMFSRCLTMVVTGFSVANEPVMSARPKRGRGA